ncbi:hypothetical protein O6H91_07G133500 [Diphasiastrum complanatum]|uniref:Uncharacterized protein n=2 Tax=Diphasiastrum complanatum TaxID=34168 RepID=A0ACC2DA41_DIPCM|nr:hypothetical protein O6H91_07G133500 [Diphasiastrum complanatum]
MTWAQAHGLCLSLHCRSFGSTKHKSAQKKWVCQQSQSPGPMLSSGSLLDVRRQYNSFSSCKRRCNAAQRDRRYMLKCGAIGEETGTRNSCNLHAEDYYEILGVSVESSYDEIRRAYRKLQKKHHPDIAGLKGHTMTLLINEAYQTLIDDDLRVKYNAIHSHRTTMDKAKRASYNGTLYSKWNGPDRPQGLFVDENTCIGCRECAFVAKNTFIMDEAMGSARVKVQWGDSESILKTAIESCPVNCIHWVEREDLPILEHLMCPQPKSSCGVYGGGWERPSNIFMAARTFKRRMTADNARSNERGFSVGGETPAQQKARMDADFKIRAGPFWHFWSWGHQATLNFSKWKAKQQSDVGSESINTPLFGRSSTSELYRLPVKTEEVSEVISLVQDWALNFASSSELPLPFPFRAELLSNGVDLSLVTTDNGVLASIGSLLVIVEKENVQEKAFENSISNDQNKLSEDEDLFCLYVKRQGTKGTNSLPGEGRILRHLKDVVSKRDTSYAMYRLPRK